MDDDATLEYSGTLTSNRHYLLAHHVFVAGEVAATAPECPIMIVRIGYGNPDSWSRGIRYAVEHGARVLVIPHGYLAGERDRGVNLFTQGGDFCYPTDNPGIRRALDEAYGAGCLIVRGTADNRGRRVVFPMSAVDSVLAVGSTNRRDEPADICCSADYVEVGAPGGQRHSSDPSDRVWGCGPEHGYVAFTGGCMAAGFAAGAAALIWSRFPHLSNECVRQIMRNTARTPAGVTQDETGWEPRLGCGIVDANRAVRLREDQLCRKLHLQPDPDAWESACDARRVSAHLRNDGVFDVERAIVVAFNGDPTRPVSPHATSDRPAAQLTTRQIGHTITRVRGLHRTRVCIDLTEAPDDGIWFETYCLDRAVGNDVDRACICTAGPATRKNSEHSGH